MKIFRLKFSIVKSFLIFSDDKPFHKSILSIIYIIASFCTFTIVLQCITVLGGGVSHTKNIRKRRKKWNEKRKTITVSFSSPEPSVIQNHKFFIS